MHCLNRQHFWAVPVLACAVFLLADRGFAQEYGFDLWTTANGLPQNTVTGVVQTPDGYLWLSTFDGLARFDGVRFTIFDKGNTSGIVNNRFARLYADRDGFYAVTEDNVVTVYRNGAFTSYQQFASVGEGVSDIALDGNGATVIETVKGAYHLEIDGFVPVPRANAAESRTKVYWGRSGAKWVIESDQATRHLADQSVSYPLTLTPEELAHPGTITLFEDRHGALWVGRRLQGFELWRLQDGKTAVFTRTDISGSGELFPRYFSDGDDGSTWFYGQAEPVSDL